MKLESRDGTEVALRPVRSHSDRPELRTGTSFDWDANWLVTWGDISTADRRGWTFEDPCLTTREAQSLGRWLRGVLDGSVTPTPPDFPPTFFTEPNVALGLEGRDHDRARLRVYFSLEARPPWLRFEAEPPDIYEFFLLLDVSRQDLAWAADEWDADLAPFPER